MEHISWRRGSSGTASTGLLQPIGKPPYKSKVRFERASSTRKSTPKLISRSHPSSANQVELTKVYQTSLSAVYHQDMSSIRKEINYDEATLKADTSAVWRSLYVLREKWARRAARLADGSNVSESCINIKDQLRKYDLTPEDLKSRNVVEVWKRRRNDVFRRIQGVAKAVEELNRSLVQKSTIASVKEQAKFKLPTDVFQLFMDRNPYRRGAMKLLSDTTSKSDEQETVANDVAPSPLRDSTEESKEAKQIVQEVRKTISVTVKRQKPKKPVDPQAKQIGAIRSKVMSSKMEPIKSRSSDLGRSRISISSIRRLPEISETAHKTLQESLVNMKQEMRMRHLDYKLREPVEASGTDGSEEDSSLWDDPPIIKFMNKAWLVWMFCKVCFGLRKYAFEGGVDPRSFEVYIPHKFFGGKSGNETSVFNPAHYRAMGESTWHRSAWESVNKRPGERDEQDIMRVKQILSVITEFATYPESVQNGVSLYCRYERFGKNRVVIKRGDFGYQYYYIYSGKVQATYAAKGRELFSRGASVKTMSRGDAFGEQAVLGHPNRRMSTVIVIENAEFLTLDYEYFELSGLKDLIIGRKLKRFDLIRQFSLFSSWSDEKVLELSNTGTNEVYRYGKSIIADARLNDFIYCCVEGSAFVIRLVDLNKSRVYNKLLEPNRVGNLANLQIHVNKQEGIGLLDDQVLDTMDWWSESQYEQKYASIMNRYEKELIRGRDTSQASFVDDSGLNVRGSTINVLRNLVSGKDPDKTELGMLAADMADNTNAGRPTTVYALGTTLTFKRTRKYDRNINKKTPHGAFVQVGRIVHGDWFGISDLWESPAHVSLVSNGCQMVRLPKCKFYELMDISTVKQLKNLQHLGFIPHDRDLSRSVACEMLWKTVAEAVSRQSYENIQNDKILQGFADGLMGRVHSMPDRKMLGSSHYYAKTLVQKQKEKKMLEGRKLAVKKHQARYESYIQSRKRPSTAGGSGVAASKMAAVAEIIIRKGRHARRIAEIEEIKSQLLDLPTPDSSSPTVGKSNTPLNSTDDIMLSENSKLEPVKSHAWTLIGTSIKDDKYKDDDERLAEASLNAKKSRLFLKTRLKILETLVHSRGELDVNLEKQIAQLFKIEEKKKPAVQLADVVQAISEPPLLGLARKSLKALKSEDKLCPLPAAHKITDPVLTAHSSLQTQPKTRCRVRITDQVAFSETRSLQLINGIESPITSIVVRNLHKHS